MNKPTHDTLVDLHQRYPKGYRIKLIRMNDPYCRELKSGMMGTVMHVDDMLQSTLHGTAGQRWAWYTEWIRAWLYTRKEK